MKKLIDKPYHIFLVAVPITILIGILIGDAEWDISIHDTYYVITGFHLTILLAILFGIIGIGYWIVQKVEIKLSKCLYWTHIGLTFGGALIVWVLNKLYREEIMEYEFNNNLSLIISLIIILMILGQIIFPINIIYRLIKKKNKTSG